MPKQNLEKKDVCKFFNDIFGLDLCEYPENKELLFNLFKKHGITKEKIDKTIKKCNKK